MVRVERHFRKIGRMLPDRYIKRYLRGGCLTFAVALKRELDLQIFVLVDRHGDQEDWIHAFVANEDDNLAIDVRGVRTLEPEVIAEGAYVVGKLAIQPATLKEAKLKIGRYPTQAEIHEAREIIRLFLKPGLDPKPLASTGMKM